MVSRTVVLRVYSFPERYTPGRSSSRPLDGSLANSLRIENPHVRSSSLRTSISGSPVAEHASRQFIAGPPTENDMHGEWGVARSTARRAVNLLRQRGLVYTVPQRGTYVTPVSERP